MGRQATYQSATIAATIMATGRTFFIGLALRGSHPPPQSGGGGPCEAWRRGRRRSKQIPRRRGPLHRADARSPSPVCDGGGEEQPEDRGLAQSAYECPSLSPWRTRLATSRNSGV